MLHQQPYETVQTTQYFFYIGTYKMENKAWLAFKNTYSASDIVTQAHLQEKFILQK